jgi:hypothetical protein
MLHHPTSTSIQTSHPSLVLRIRSTQVPVQLQAAAARSIVRPRSAVRSVLVSASRPRFDATLSSTNSLLSDPPTHGSIDWPSSTRGASSTDLICRDGGWTEWR